jgi:hypothetical protein
MIKGTQILSSQGNISEVKETLQHTLKDTGIECTRDKTNAEKDSVQENKCQERRLEGARTNLQTMGRGRQRKGNFRPNEADS